MDFLPMKSNRRKGFKEWDNTSSTAYWTLLLSRKSDKFLRLYARGACKALWSLLCTWTSWHSMAVRCVLKCSPAGCVNDGPVIWELTRNSALRNEVI